MLAPLNTNQPSLADQAYDAIVAAVLNREIGLGDRIVMDQIAESLGIPRTLVRDAFDRLENEGLLLATGRCGFVVREVEDDEVVEAGNRHLLASFHGLWGASVALFAYGQLFPAQPADDVIAEEHAPLLASIASADPEAARLAMISHIGEGAEQHIAHR